MYKHMANSVNCFSELKSSGRHRGREVKGVVCVIPLAAAYLSIHGCSVPIDSCPRMPCPICFFTKFARGVTQVFFFLIVLYYRSNSPKP